MPNYGTSPLRDQLTALMVEGDRTMLARHDRASAGLAAGDRTDPGFRVERPRAAVKSDDEGGDSAPVSTEPTEDERTKLYIYSEIGGWFGVWPDEVVAALADIKGDIELHLHSPGGDAFDGVAIYNALRDHDGKIFGQVDGLAASAASVIAMAADELVMKNGAQLMIHDAWGFAQGPSEDMAQMATFLGKVSDATAEIYAARAGGSADDWRTAMKAESWYTGREAVEAGLADRVEMTQQAAKNSWSLKVFQHAGRADAPDPLMPAGRWELGQWNNKLARHPKDAGVEQPSSLVDLDALARFAAEETAQRAPGGMVDPAAEAVRIHQAAQRAGVRSAIEAPAAPAADGPTHQEGGSTMPVDRVKIREALGLGPDATDAEVTTAYAAAYSATPAPAPAAEPAPTQAPDPTDSSRLAQMAKAMGVTLIDPAQLVAMQQMAEQGKLAFEKQRRDERDQEISKALDLGKIELSSVERWKQKWDADPEGCRETLNALAANMVPMQAAGYAGTVAANEADSRLFDLYPEMKSTGGRR